MSREFFYLLKKIQAYKYSAVLSCVLHYNYALYFAHHGLHYNHKHDFLQKTVL